MVGGEHHAGGRDHDVEAAIGERQAFRIGNPERHVEAVGEGALAGAIEEGRHVVGGDDLAATPGCGQRDIAVAGRDIEHLLAGAHVERFAELFADDLQRGADHGVVARRPGRLLTGLQRRQVGRGGRGGGAGLLAVVASMIGS